MKICKIIPSDEPITVGFGYTYGKRAEKTKRWTIQDKFINIEFSDFICNINVYSINNKYVDKRPIKNSFASVEEWANWFQLWELHGITLEDILKLLKEKGCARIFKNENFIQYHHQNMIYLEMEILARISELDN